MSESKHTPGPWRVRWPNKDRYSPSRQRTVVIDDPLSPHGTRCICWVGPTNHNDVKDAAIHERHDANARLIAAAPDLLEALNVMLEEPWLFDSSRPKHWAQEQARAAIKKATEMS